MFENFLFKFQRIINDLHHVHPLAINHGLQHY